MYTLITVMSKRLRRSLISLLVLLFLSLLFQGLQKLNLPQLNTVLGTQTQTVTIVTPTPQSPSPSQTAQVHVTKVTDGDTIHVNLNGKNETIRIIGIDTPETVDPRKPVQCYGKAASDRAKQLLTNQTVRLESDPTQGDRDKYGRLLRYVWINGQTDYGLETIQQGYAHEYTYDVPYKYQAEYKQAQRDAQNNKRGLWADNACITPTP